MIYLVLQRIVDLKLECVESAFVVGFTYKWINNEKTWPTSVIWESMDDDINVECSIKFIGGNLSIFFCDDHLANHSVFYRER